ncbi:MAG TPA: glycosyltransferase family 39 protein [Gemmatimonadaceae bacterium]|nr:glycosyltransferase family 39 protein [Gemmatimonadaceae bacterium]
MSGTSIAVLIVTVAAVIRGIFATIITLPPDETYYWEWSRHLAGGFFDHPPAIAVLIRAGTALFGVTPFGVRVGSVCVGWAASLLLVLLARRLANERAAIIAAVALCCMPLAAAGLVLATPDAPLLFAFTFTLFALDHAISAEPGSALATRWWLGAGVALGIAFVSKYNAVLLPLGVLIACLFLPSLRRQLRTPGPYLAAIVAVLVFLPVVFWNARHQWVSFRFQLDHGFSSGRGTPFSRETSLILGQVGLVSPILFVLFAIVVAQGLRSREPRRTVLAAVSATVFLFFCIGAWRHSAEANWQAPAYVPAIALVAVMATTGRSRAWSWLTAAACAVGAVFSVAIYVQAIAPVLPITARDDPTARGMGWDSLAARMQLLADRESAQSGARVWLGGDRYQEASEIAFHLPTHPQTFALNIEGRPNEYDIWPGFADVARRGDDLMLAFEVQSADSVGPVVRRLRPYFDDARLLEVVDLRRGGEVRTRRRVWLLERWRASWPPKGSP